MEISTNDNAGVFVERTVKTSRPQNYIFLGIFLLMGLIALGAGIWQGVQSLRLVTAGMHATGTVRNVQVGTSMDSNHRQQTYYVSIIDFQLPDGTQQEFSQQINLGIGQQLDVLYLGDKPQTARVATFSGLWLTPLGFSFLGGLFIVVMGYLTVSMRKREQEIDSLKTSGVRGVATIVGFVQVGQAKTFNGQRMQMYEIFVKTKDPATKQDIQFKSDSITLKVTSVDTLIGKEVPVYIDPGNTASHYVDLSGIEQYDINLAGGQPAV